jgi:GTPase KRas
METSAKSRVNVEESFYQLVREIRKDLKGPDGKQPGNKKKSGKCSIL